MPDMNKKIIIISAIFFSAAVSLIFSGFVSAKTENPLDLIKQKLLNAGIESQAVNAAGVSWGAVDFGKMMMGDVNSIIKAQKNVEQAQKFLSSGTGKMTPEIWLEITARLRCVDAAVVNEEKTNAIMSQFGVTAAEYAAYAWQTTFKLADDGKNAGDWNVEEMNKKYEAKYNELIASGNCGIATATTTISGMDDDKWVEMSALFMCLPNLEDVDVQHGWIFSKYGATINEFVAYGKKVKVRADYSEMKEKVRARYWTFLGNRVCDKINESVAAASGTLPYIPFLMDDQNLWDYLKIKFKNIGCKIGFIANGLDCPEPVIINHSTTTVVDGDRAGGQTGAEKESWFKKLKCKVKKFFGKKC